MLKKSNSTLFINLCTAASSAVLLIACGGGGGGGNESENTAPSTPIAITTDNSVSVAAEAFNNSAINEGPTTILGAKTDSGSGLSLNEINNNLSQIISKRSTMGLIASGVVEACAQGGTADVPASGLGTYVLNNCIEDGITFNGELTVEGNGNIPSDFTGTFTFNNFSATTSRGADTFNGLMNISWTDDGTVETTNINSQKLSLTSGADYYDLVNLQDDFTSNNNTQVNTNSTSYSLNSSVLDGQVTLTTTTLLQSYSYNDFPFAGQIICTGANNSKVRASVNPGGTGVASDTLTIETDSDGDDIYESSQVLMWSEL